MYLVVNSGRLVEKIITTSGTPFAVAPSTNHLDGSWSPHHLYDGEFGVMSSANPQLALRISGSIYYIPLATASGAVNPNYANKALSNLSSVSINTALVPQVNIDLGTTAAPFRTLYVSGNILIGGTAVPASADKVLTIYEGTVPSGSYPVDAFTMFATSPIAGNSSPSFRTENGTLIRLYTGSATPTSPQDIADRLQQMGLQLVGTIVTPIAQGGTAKTTIAANKMWVALSTDTLSETPYFDVTEQTIVTTIAFTAGTPPATPLNLTYRWDQVGNKVTVRINLLYTTAGVTVTGVLIPMPADLPAPVVPAGFSGASAIMYYGSGGAATAITAPAANQGKGYLRRNAANNGWEFGIDTASSSAKAFYCQVTYFST